MQQYKKKLHNIYAHNLKNFDTRGMWKVKI